MASSPQSERPPHEHPTVDVELSPEIVDRFRTGAVLEIASAKGPLSGRTIIDNLNEPPRLGGEIAQETGARLLDEMQRDGLVARRDKYEEYLPTPAGIELARQDAAYQAIEAAMITGIIDQLQQTNRARLTPRGLILDDPGTSGMLGVKVEGGRNGLRGLGELDLTEEEASRIADHDNPCGEVREVKRTYAIPRVDSNDLVETITIDYPWSNRTQHELRAAELPVILGYVKIIHHPVHLGRLKAILAELDGTADVAGLA